MSGATTTIPTPSDKNQASQTSPNGSDLCNKVIVAAPPMAEAAAPMQAAIKNPKTRRTPTNAKVRPNHRSINQAVKTASPALQTPLNIEVQRLLSLMTLAAMVAAMIPMTTSRANAPSQCYENADGNA